MRLGRRAILALIVKGYQQTQMPVRVPDNYASKARALVKDGFLIAEDGVCHFSPTALGKMMAEEI